MQGSSYLTVTFLPAVFSHESPCESETPSCWASPAVGPSVEKDAPPPACQALCALPEPRYPVSCLYCPPSFPFLARSETMPNWLIRDPWSTCTSAAAWPWGEGGCVPRGSSYTGGTLASSSAWSGVSRTPPCSFPQIARDTYSSSARGLLQPLDLTRGDWSEGQILSILITVSKIFFLSPAP